jgi:hypothetical protein
VKLLLAKFAFRRAVGLYLGDHEVAISEVASTPLGPVEISSCSEACEPDKAEDVLRRLMAPMLSRKQRLSAAVGLPNSRIFFGTRLTRTGGEVTAELVLQKVFSSPNIRVEDLTVDLIRSDVGRMPVASVAACRKKYMGSVISLLSHLGIRPHCAEPEACAMVRIAAQLHHFPRRNKNLLCVFLNAGHGLAVLVTGGVPLAWRQFVLTPGSESLVILSAARTLQTQYKHYGIESAADYAMIFGRADLHEQLKREQFPSDLGTRVIWHEGPELSGHSTAYGLALGGLSSEPEGFDLSRHLKPQPSIREIFPWGDLVFVILFVVCMGAILGFHYMKLKDMALHVQTESSQYQSPGNISKNLEKEEKEIRQKIDAVRDFLTARVLWTANIESVTDCLPGTTKLADFDGLAVACKQISKSLTLRTVAMLPEDGTIGVPPDIDLFINNLRKSDVLKQNYPVFELPDIKRAFLRDKAGAATATFTIVGLPQGKGKGGK